MKKQIEKLPKWAQQVINDQKTEIELLKAKLKRLEEINYLLNNYNCFITPLSTQYDYIELYFANGDRIQSLCSVGKNDRIVICRKREV